MRERMLINMLISVSLFLLCCYSLVVAEERPSEAEIGSVQVYATIEEGRKEIFPEGERFVREARVIPEKVKATLTERLGRPIEEDSVVVDLVYSVDGEFLGYAAVGDEVGKYRPITFLVGIDPAFRVEGVVVMVFRESRGGQVRRSRFLRQYRGKSSADPVRINRDIVNITGATLSVRALNFGVRKAIALIEVVFGEEQDL